MKGKIEVLEVQEGWIRTEWGRPDLTPGSSKKCSLFLEFQLLRLDFNSHIASSVKDYIHDVETFAELLEFLE